MFALLKKLTAETGCEGEYPGQREQRDQKQEKI